MTIALFDISVLAYIQTLTGVANTLARGRSHLSATDGALEDMVNARLIDDMLPFSYQVRSCVHHSLGALKAMDSGTFAPPAAGSALDYQGLQDHVEAARQELAAYTPAQVNAWQERDMQFAAGERRMDFRVPDFVVSFSLPNLHFHAATAYDLLRMRGVKLGKRDYLGPPRLKA